MVPKSLNLLNHCRIDGMCVSKWCLAIVVIAIIVFVIVVSLIVVFVIVVSLIVVFIIVVFVIVVFAIVVFTIFIALTQRERHTRHSSYFYCYRNRWKIRQNKNMVITNVHWCKRQRKLQYIQIWYTGWKFTVVFLQEGKGCL